MRRRSNVTSDGTMCVLVFYVRRFTIPPCLIRTLIEDFLPLGVSRLATATQETLAAGQRAP